MRINPILKKWTQHEENSLDLDNPNDLRDLLIMYDFGTAARNVNGCDSSSISGKNYHNRSASEASQYSITTVGSGQRTGSFVHPFQQTPRPYTPPLVASTLDLFRANEISSRLAEEEAEMRHYNYYTSTSSSSSYRSQSFAQPSSSPHISQAHNQTKNSCSRLALVSSYPCLSSQTNNKKPSSSGITTPQSSSSTLTDRGFRLRSRSEVVSRDRAHSIQEARRKFLEKEMAQEEKAAREEIKQLEKRQQKEAIRIERSNRQSSTSESYRSKRSKSDATIHETNESFSDKDEEIDPHDPLFNDEKNTERKRNGSLAKQKTHSAWAMFLMWFRMRLMHLGGRISCKS